MKVPYTPDGQCDGKSVKRYSQSWWLGIGGKDDTLLYQAGVRGTLTCSVGTTVRHVNYYGWTEDAPLQREQDYSQFTRKIKPGDVMTVSVTSNYNTNPTGAGVMIANLTDTTQTITTGNIRRADTSTAPHLAAEATLERQIQSNGTAYYFPVSSPGSNPTSSAASAMFFDLKYDFVYET